MPRFILSLVVIILAKVPGGAHGFKIISKTIVLAGQTAEPNWLKFFGIHRQRRTLQLKSPSSAKRWK